MRDLNLWNPRNELDPAEPYYRMGQMMDALWHGWLGRFAVGTTEEPILRPAMDVIENDNNLTVRIDLPGVKPDDVHVRVENNILTVSGEIAETKDEEGQRYHYRQRRYGKFQRSVSLPDTLDAEKVEAHFENGVLRVVVPKKAQAQPKQITVKTSE
ncbi:MAG TPA: Hsp20/alpha crystallin family protein [Aggregatilineaceae bacterium]|nr:Hsp20/alpha crystallin family protein [Aggregatilineaceae bacterium]